MTGKHEPPTKTTFYISLATSAIRALLVVAAVGLGIFVLARAFTGPADRQEAEPRAPRRTPAQVRTPSPTEAQTASPRPTLSPRVEGVLIAVFNGTDVDGLAHSVAEDLQREGYVNGQEPADAPTPVQTTTLFYRDRQGRVDARHMRDQFFEGAVLEKLSPDVDVVAGIDIAIYLGADYAATA